MGSSTYTSSSTIIIVHKYLGDGMDPFTRLRFGQIEPPTVKQSPLLVHYMTKKRAASARRSEVERSPMTQMFGVRAEVEQPFVFVCYNTRSGPAGSLAHAPIDRPGKTRTIQLIAPQRGTYL